MVELDKSVAPGVEMRSEDPEQIEKRKLFLKLLTDEPLAKVFFEGLIMRNK